MNLNSYTRDECRSCEKEIEKEVVELKGKAYLRFYCLCEVETMWPNELKGKKFPEKWSKDE